MFGKHWHAAPRATAARWLRGITALTSWPASSGAVRVDAEAQREQARLLSNRSVMVGCEGTTTRCQTGPDIVASLRSSESGLRQAPSTSSEALIERQYTRALG